MTIASDAIKALNVTLTAAQPVDSAPRSTITALQSQTAMTIASIDADILQGVTALDNIVPTGSMPDVMALMVTSAVAATAEHSSMADARGLVGRVASNLSQIVS